MVNVAATTQGGRKITAALAQTPVYLGFSSDTSPPQVSVEWDFIDWPFLTDPDFGHRHTHRLYVKAHEPAIAVAPDIMEGISPEAVIEEADRLLQYADDVVVIPKTPEFGPADVPDRFRVGVPVKVGVPDFYAQAAYRQASSVHLLGGTPLGQIRWTDQEMNNVASADTAQLIASAEYAKVYAGDGRYDRLPDLPFGFYGYVVLNYRLYAAEWGMGREPVNISAMTTQERLRMAFLDESEVRDLATTLYPDSVEFDTAADGGLLVTVPASASVPGAADDLTRVLGDAGLELTVEATRGATIIRVEGYRDPLEQTTFEELS